MKNWTIALVGVCLMLCFSGTAYSQTHQWAGLDWSIRGATTATNQLDGSVLIETLGGSAGDPALDNWVLYANLPVLNGAKPKWMEFSFIDNQTATNGYGPRAYASAGHDNGETLIQGGVYAGYGNYWVNYSRWENSDWLPTSWYNPGSRSDAEHTVKIGLFDDDSVGIWFDGNLVDRIYANQANSKGNTYGYLPVDGFSRAYLGMTGDTSDTFSVTYTDFSFGYEAVPEPGTIGLLASAGLALAGLGVIRRRKMRLQSN